MSRRLFGGLPSSQVLREGDQVAMGPLETLMKSVILGVFAVVGLRYVLVNALRIAHMRRIERTGTQTIAHVTRGWETRLSRRQLVYWLEVRFDLPDGRVVEADR